ncbi:MAG: MFS transporter [Roseovarius sp.]|nr:MFS transporter [Roseovarius sp.]
MQDPPGSTKHPHDTAPGLVPVHGISGIFVGIGLARFAYSPIIPLLIRDGWYTEYQAQLLGAWGSQGTFWAGSCPSVWRGGLRPRVWREPWACWFC